MIHARKIELRISNFFFFFQVGLNPNNYARFGRLTAPHYNYHLRNFFAQSSFRIEIMPKRKLGELDGPPRSGDKARKMSMKAVRLGVKFDQGVQIITKGLKTARGFERQKLSRREKTARSDNNRITLIKLGEEIEALKVWKIYLSRKVTTSLNVLAQIRNSHMLTSLETRRLIITLRPSDISSNNCPRLSGLRSYLHSRNSKSLRMSPLRDPRVPPRRIFWRDFSNPTR